MLSFCDIDVNLQEYLGHAWDGIAHRVFLALFNFLNLSQIFWGRGCRAPKPFWGLIYLDYSIGKH